MAYERRGHHVVNTAAEWELRKEGRVIRRTPTLIVPMERELHNEIHDNCPAVPLLGHHTLMRVNRDFTEGRTSIQSMENLMSAIETAGNYPRAHSIEKELANLAVWALDLQRPFIAEAERYNRERSLV